MTCCTLYRHIAAKTVGWKDKKDKIYTILQFNIAEITEINKFIVAQYVGNRSWYFNYKITHYRSSSMLDWTLGIVINFI